MNSLVLTFFSWGGPRLERKTYFLCIALYLFIFLPYLDLLPWGVGLLGPAILLLSLIPYSLRFRAKPHFSALAMAILTLIIFKSLGEVLGLMPGVAFLSILAPLKLFELKERRDLYLYCLILILLLVGCLVSVDSFYALLHVGVVIFALFALLAGRERLKILGLIFLLSIPTSLVLFILFPRLQWGNLLFQETSARAKTGFVESLEPGKLSQVVRDNSDFFRVEFVGATPNISQMYWRGAVLSTPQGMHWFLGGPSKSYHPLKSTGENYHYRVLFGERGEGSIFTLENTFKVKSIGRAKVRAQAGNSFKIENYSGKALHYEAMSAQSDAEVVTEKNLKKSERSLYLRLPEKGVSARLRSFAAEFHPTLEARERIQKFLRHLQKEPFRYSLTPGLYDRDTGLDEFFFERRVGFCEHYASLTATMGRLMNIPTRVVVGFHGGRKNPYGDYFVVRGGDAHAWVEMWFEESGWQRLDPVAWIAPSRIELGANEYYELLSNYEGGFRRFLSASTTSFLSEFLQGVDVIFYRLNQSFIAYDMDAQREFLNSLGLSNWSRGKLISLALGIFSLICAPFFLWHWQRSRWRDQVSVSYQKLCRKLELLGVEVKPWFGPETVAQQVGHSSLSERTQIAAHLHHFAQLKYSARGVTPEVQSEMKQLLKKALHVLASSK